MSEYMGSIQQRLPELSLEQITLLLAGLAQVGYKPAPQWMKTTMLQLLQRPATGSDYQTVLRLRGALKKMKYTPSAYIMAGLEKQIDGMAMGLLLGQVQQLREGLAPLEYVPHVPAAAAVLWPSAFCPAPLGCPSYLALSSAALCTTTAGRPARRATLVP